MNNYFKPILLLFSFFFFLNSHAQVSDSLSQSDIDFINYAIKDDRYGIYLINSIPAYDLNEVKKYIDKGFFRNGMVDQCGTDISDTIRLSKQDKHSIYKRLKQLKNYKWTLADAKKLNFQDISLISIDSREYIIEYDIIPPIYFQDNKYCIFSFDYGCGGLCGHGEIAIYEKTKHGWRIWTLLTEWDS